MKDAPFLMEGKMIKKIERQKQFSNQEMQLPRDISELVQRYDLENKSILNFLDYLVDYLNERGI